MHINMDLNKQCDELGTQMNRNLKILRESLGLSQKEMASKLLVSDTIISRIEKGDRKVTNRLLTQICKEFNVNKDWFLSGEGEMFNSLDDLELSELMGKLFADDDIFLKKVFLTFAKLNDNERAVVMKIIDSLSNK